MKGLGETLRAHKSGLFIMHWIEIAIILAIKFKLNRSEMDFPCN